MSEEGGDNHEQQQRVELRTAITSGKRRNAKQDPIRDFQTEDHKTSSRNFQRVMKNDRLHIVEGSAPSEAEKEAALA
jgi:hypothetical protein